MIILTPRSPAELRLPTGTPLLPHQDVLAGQRIPGSRYYRQICSTCTAPLRVSGLFRARTDLVCDRCFNRHNGGRVRLDRGMR